MVPTVEIYKHVNTPIHVSNAHYGFETCKMIGCYTYGSIVITGTILSHILTPLEKNNIWFSGYNYFSSGVEHAPNQMSKFNTSMLRNDPIVKIESGSCFFIVQTRSGSLYGSGTNNFHQLASDDTRDQQLIKIDLPFSPTSFSCGNYYTVFYSMFKLV